MKLTTKVEAMITERRSIAAVLLLGGGVISAIFSGCRTPPPLPEAWSVTIPQKNLCGQSQTTGLSYKDGFIYCVGSANFDDWHEATLYGISATSGSVLWDEPVSMDRACGRFPLFAAGEGLVCYKNTDGSLHALDAQTGREKWRFPDFLSVLGVEKGAVQILDGRGHYAELEVAAGAIKRATAIEGRCGEALECLSGTLYRISDRKVKAVDTLSGNVLWTAPADRGWLFVDAGEGIVFVISSEGGDQLLRTLDARTGRELWRRVHWGPDPVVDDGTVYLSPGTPDMRDQTLRFDAKTGALLGTTRGRLWPPAEPVVCEGLMYSPNSQWEYFGLGPADYGIVVKDTVTGRDLWNTALRRGSNMSKPVVVPGFAYLEITAADCRSVRLTAYKIPR
jgi:outer membrane protein assembly factor BamB